jgi:hypothetical protein
LLGNPKWSFVLRVTSHDTQHMEPTAQQVFNEFFAAVTEDYLATRHSDRVALR